MTRASISGIAGCGFTDETGYSFDFSPLAYVYVALCEYGMHPETLIAALALFYRKYTIIGTNAGGALPHIIVPVNLFC